jgi:hypothetical protein
MTNSISTSYTGTTVGRTLVASTSGTTLNVSVDGNAVASGVTIPAAPTSATYAGMYADTTGATGSWPQYDSFSVVAGP